MSIEHKNQELLARVAELEQHCAERVVLPHNMFSVMAMILQALDRDALDGKAIRGEMAEELRAVLSEMRIKSCG